ncbi:MAG: hypothetical protein KGH71_03540 [Candidatus Micrarchaeota archaeon]|nr:hypothetical protein [Candidatus Micrarchaeota archaeon]
MLTYKLYYFKIHDAADLLYYNFVTDFNAIALKETRIGLLHLLSTDDRNLERINFALKNGGNMYQRSLDGRTSFEFALGAGSIKNFTLYYQKDKNIVKKYRDPNTGKHLLQKSVNYRNLPSFQAVARATSNHQEISSIKDRMNRNTLQSIAEIPLETPGTPERPGRPIEAIQADQELINHMILSLARNKHSFINMVRNKDRNGKTAYDLSRYSNPSTFYHIEMLEESITGKSTANRTLDRKKVKVLEKKLFPQKSTVPKIRH